MGSFTACPLAVLAGVSEVVETARASPLVGAPAPRRAPPVAGAATPPARGAVEVAEAAAQGADVAAAAVAVRVAAPPGAPRRGPDVAAEEVDASRCADGARLALAEAAAAGTARYDDGAEEAVLSVGVPPT